MKKIQVWRSGMSWGYGEGSDVWVRILLREGGIEGESVSGVRSDGVSKLGVVRSADEN